jgi:RNA polymerase sigma-70 factor, ECF subfamily
VLQTADRAAFEHLARRELGGLYALARRLAGRDAEDLVQEALLRACRSFGSLRDRQAGGQWLRVILTNVWRDRVRKEAREPTEVGLDDIECFSLHRTLVEEDPFPYSDALHLDFLGVFSEDDVHAVLQRIQPRYRAPLVLRYVEGFPTKQIARMLELPLGTVLSQLLRGRSSRSPVSATSSTSPTWTRARLWRTSGPARAWTCLSPRSPWGRPGASPAWT